MIADLNYLKTMSGGDPKFIREMIELFREQIDEYKLIMPELLQEKRYEELSKVAHKAKSSVAVMGMSEAAEILKELEILAHGGIQVEQYEGMISTFLTQSQLALKELDGTYQQRIKMLETTNINDILVVRLKDSQRLNALITEPVKEALLVYFNKPNTNLIFNLEGVTFIDSSGFGVFLSAMKAANNNYGQFKICNVNADVMELFKLLQLHHVFEIYDTLESCLKSFNQ